jgi:hypothetical protein
MGCGELERFEGAAAADFRDDSDVPVPVSGLDHFSDLAAAVASVSDGVPLRADAWLDALNERAERDDTESTDKARPRLNTLESLASRCERRAARSLTLPRWCDADDRVLAVCFDDAEATEKTVEESLSAVT